MGSVTHHAIIVTTWDKGMLEKCAVVVEDIFNIKPQVQVSSINDYFTILVGPDGSKDGWEHSEQGDKKRETFKIWLDANKYEDGSSCLDWVEIAYGDVDQDGVTDSQNMRYKKHREALDQ